MSLSIVVKKNAFPAAQNPYFVRSANSDLVDFEDFVAEMADGRTTLSQRDIIAAIQLAKEKLVRSLAQGASIKLPFGTFFLCASGTMSSLEDSFLPSDASNDHELRVHFRPSSDFEDQIRAAVRVVRVEPVDRMSPVPRSIVSAAGSEPGKAKPGDIVDIRGLRLKFDPANAQEGVFFVGASAGAGGEARAELYPLVQPRTIIAAMPPALPEGSYSVVIRSLAGGTTLREGRLEGFVVAN